MRLGHPSKNAPNVAVSTSDDQKKIDTKTIVEVF